MINISNNLIGNKVRVINKNGLNVPIGSTAIITGFGYVNNWVLVEWICTHGKSQMNGSYSLHHFELLPYEQLLFSFMRK
jgi:hypothetical protein